MLLEHGQPGQDVDSAVIKQRPSVTDKGALEPCRAPGLLELIDQVPPHPIAEGLIEHDDLVAVHALPDCPRAVRALTAASPSSSA